MDREGENTQGNMWFNEENKDTFDIRSFIKNRIKQIINGVLNYNDTLWDFLNYTYIIF